MSKFHRHYHWPPRARRNVVLLQRDRPYYDIETLVKNRLKAAPQFIQNLDIEAKLEGHVGCVNCLEWSSNGQLLASGSDDNRLILWKPFHHDIKPALDIRTPHQGNIFSVVFLPQTNDALIATAAADRYCYVFDVNRATDLDSPCWKCSCHNQRVKRLATVPDSPCIFWSAGEDGRILQFDIREPHHCTRDEKVCLIDLQNHVGATAEAKCVAVNPRRSEQLAVGSSDAYARVYDRRMIKLFRIGRMTDSLAQNDRQLEDNLSRDCVTYFCPGHLNTFKDRKLNLSSKTITYLSFSPEGTELLVNMGSEQIYLYDLNNAQEPVYLSMPQFNKSGDTDESESLETPTDTAISSLELPSANSPSPTSVTYTKQSKLPKHIEELKKCGNDFMENEKYLQAINQYSDCIQLLNNHPVFYLNRATAYMRRNWYGDMYAGLRDCQTALRLDPTYVKAHFRLARALFELGFVIESSECLDELKKRFPKDSNNKQIQLLSQDIQAHVEQNRNSNQNGSDSPDTELSDNEMYWRTIAKDFSERFVGHCNTTTDIKEANYFGDDGSFIVAGSDEGNFYIWERPSNKIVAVYKGDTTIVNCVQPHPTLCLLATSGIDHEIRLWSPKQEEFDAENRVTYYDTTVVVNQQRMMADPFEFNASGAVCRAS